MTNTSSKFEPQSAGLILFGIVYFVLRMGWCGDFGKNYSSSEYILKGCNIETQRILEARDAYSSFQRGELRLYSEPAISSLEEMAKRELPNCGFKTVDQEW